MLGPEQLNIAARPIAPPPMAFTNLYVSEKAAKHIGLKENQIVRGVIIHKDGLLKVVINNLELDLKQPKGLKVGDQLDFRVEAGIDGRLLKPITLLPFQAGAHSIPEGGMASRLLSLLYRPKQSLSQVQLFKSENLKAMLDQSKSGLGTPIPAEFIAKMSHISPETIRSALLNSGLFNEYLLATKQPARQDLKQILRALSSDKNIAATTKLAIDSATDEIESRQLNGLQAQHNQEASYHFLLPFVDANPVEVHFERRAHAVDGAKADWVINLHTESEVIGALWLKTTVRPDSKIEMTAWAERSNVAEQVRRGESELKNNLSHFNLQLTKLNVLNMTRPVISPEFSGPGQVLDVRT